MTTRKKAVAKGGTAGLPAEVKEALRKQAEAQAGTASPPTGRQIKLTHSGFKLPDGRISPSPMTVVVMDVISRNVYYNSPYVAGQVKPATCAAQGFKKNDALVPFDNVLEQQNPTCYGCYQNEFGSAQGGTGLGKACQNRKLMAVLPPDATDEDDMLILDASPTSTGSVDAFVLQVAGKGTPVMASTIDVHIKVNEKSQALSIELKNLDVNERVVEMYPRYEEARNMLETIVPNLGKVEDKPAPPKALTRKKATRKKKATARR